MKNPLGDFKNPLDAADDSGVPVNTGTARKVTGSKSMNGNYAQVNFRLRPEIAEEIDEWVDHLGLGHGGKAKLKRYLVWRGLEALKDGERPEVQETAVRELVDY